MNSYNYFADFYDILTENVDYKVRSDYISDFFSANGIENGSVLDLACGTGTMSKLLADKGYEVTGMDLSDEMLCIASNKCSNVSLIKSDISNFNLPFDFDCCVCLLDSLNHLETEQQWESCFSSVAKALKLNGIFIFDINTVYKHREILKNNTFVFDEEDFFLCWDNEPLDDDKVKILLDVFVFNGKNYDRYSESFIERAFSIDNVKKMLRDNFEILGIYDDLSLNAPHDKSERIYFVCKRK